jgi:protein-tyrosine phosphatase
MIDCHTHILPNLDDGSPDLASSLSTIRQMAAGGINAVFCTSHFMAGVYHYSHADYMSVFKELESEVKFQGINITLYPGAEVYVMGGAVDLIKEHKLTLADSKYVLIETDLNGFPADLAKNVFEILRAGFKPILAHAERYVSVMMKSHEAKELINRSVYIQVNAPSVIGGYGEKVKQTAWKLLNKGWVHLMGSDDHTRTAYGAYFDARNKILEHIDAETAELLTKIHPQAIIDNQKIDYEYVMIQSPPKRRHHSRFLKHFGI